MLYMDNDDEWLQHMEDLMDGLDAPSAPRDTSTPVLKNQKRKSVLQENVDPVENEYALDLNCGEEVNRKDDGESSEQTAASTPIIQIGSRKRKAEKITPAEKRIKIAAPSTPRKAPAATPTDFDEADSDDDDDGHGTKIRQIKNLNGKSLGVLQKYRDKGEKPPFSIAAMIICYYEENNKSTATYKEIRDYIGGFVGYQNMNENETRKLMDNVSASFRTHPTLFKKKKPGEYIYLKAVEEEKPVEASEEIDRRPHTVLEHTIVRKDGIGSFIWDRWRWKIIVNARSNGKEAKYARCVNCHDLWKDMKKCGWMIGEVQIPYEAVNSIKFEGNVIKGCPWLPGDAKAPHLCRHKTLYKKMIEELKLLNRHNAQAERNIALNAALEAKIKAFAEKLAESMDQIPPELKNFIDSHEQIHAPGPRTKPAFLYMIRVIGEKKPRYYGISGDVEQREYRHPIIKKLIDARLNVEMIVSPLGYRTLNFVQEIESSLIRLTKDQEIYADCDIENDDLGHFVTKDAYVKDSIFNKNHPQHEQMKIVMKQLVKFTMEHGYVVQATGGIPDRDSIVQNKFAKSNTATLLAQMFPSAPAASEEQPSSSSADASPPSSQQQQLSPSLPPKSKYPNAFKLLEELSAEHPWNDSLLPASVYFLVSPGTEIIKRYGMSLNIDQREAQHNWYETIKEGFEMVVIPLPSINNRFAEDLEAMLIRLSKKTLLNDGKQNVNLGNDNGRFNTAFSVFEHHTEHPSPKRQFLIAALNEIISWTFKSQN